MSEPKELVLKPGWLKAVLRSAQIYKEEHDKADKRAARRIKKEDHADEWDVRPRNAHQTGNP